MKEGSGTRELASFSSLGDGLLDCALMCGSNSLNWNCAHAGWGMGGPHKSLGKRPRKCGDTGVVPFSTADSGPNTQAVMGFGGTGHMAYGIRAAVALRLLHALSPWHSGISPHGCPLVPSSFRDMQESVVKP